MLVWARAWTAFATWIEVSLAAVSNPSKSIAIHCLPIYHRQRKPAPCPPPPEHENQCGVVQEDALRLDRQAPQPAVPPGDNRATMSLCVCHGTHFRAVNRTSFYPDATHSARPSAGACRRAHPVPDRVGGRRGSADPSPVRPDAWVFAAHALVDHSSGSVLDVAITARALCPYVRSARPLDDRCTTDWTTGTAWRNFSIFDWIDTDSSIVWSQARRCARGVFQSSCERGTWPWRAVGVHSNGVSGLSKRCCDPFGSDDDGYAWTWQTIAIRFVH